MKMKRPKFTHIKNKIITFFKNIKSKIFGTLKSVKNVLFDNLFELVLLSGLGSLFHGLYLKWPWIAFTVIGSLLIIFGVFGILPKGPKIKDKGK